MNEARDSNNADEIQVSSRPIFPDERRDLLPDIARRATFIMAIASVEDRDSFPLTGSAERPAQIPQASDEGRQRRIEGAQ
jgi:hypothetical protein